jgi:hypothetical protein
VIFFQCSQNLSNHSSLFEIEIILVECLVLEASLYHQFETQDWIRPRLGEFNLQINSETWVHMASFLWKFREYHSRFLDILISYGYIFCKIIFGLLRWTQNWSHLPSHPKNCCFSSYWAYQEQILEPTSMVVLSNFLLRYSFQVIFYER